MRHFWQILPDPGKLKPEEKYKNKRNLNSRISVIYYISAIVQTSSPGKDQNLNLNLRPQDQKANVTVG